MSTAVTIIKLCGLLCDRHNVPPPPASCDLNSLPQLSGWRSPRTLLMRVIVHVLKLCTNIPYIHIPSRSEDTGDFRSRH